jgi:hypothetical protein
MDLTSKSILPRLDPPERTGASRGQRGTEVDQGHYLHQCTGRSETLKDLGRDQDQNWPGAILSAIMNVCR